MMRATLITLVFLNIVGSLFPMIACTQSLVPVVVNSSGQSFSNGEFYIEYSIGESITTTIGVNNNTLTQGFLQPELNVEITKTETCLEAIVFAYPNPTYDQVLINTGCDKVRTYKLLDLLGRVLLSEDWTGQAIELNELPPSAYVIQLFDERNSLIRSVKVIKKI